MHLYSNIAAAAALTYARTNVYREGRWFETWNRYRAGRLEAAQHSLDRLLYFVARDAELNAEVEGD